MMWFFFIYFTITGEKNIVRYTEDFVILMFHCNDLPRGLVKKWYIMNTF